MTDAPKGLGLVGDAGCGPYRDIYTFLSMGYPRLALARALGVQFAPYIINVRATFDEPDVATIPDVGSDVKVVQDTLIDCLITRITIDRPGDNVFQTLSDFFFNYQSGIQATLDILGAPRYSVAPRFTPLSTLSEIVSGAAHWPFGWVLTYQQQLQMTFNRPFALPEFPVTVVCSYRGWIPIGEMFVQMTNQEAMKRLIECGYQIPDCYVTAGK